MNWEKLKKAFWEAFKYGIVAVIAGVIAGVISTGMNSNSPPYLWMSFIIILMFLGIGGLTIVIYFIPNKTLNSKDIKSTKDNKKNNENVKGEFKQFLKKFYVTITAIFFLSAFFGYLFSFFF